MHKKKNPSASLHLGHLGRNCPEHRRALVRAPAYLAVAGAAAGSPRGRKEGGSGAPPSPRSLFLSPSPSLGSLPWWWWPTPASRGRIRLPGGRIRTLRRQICPPRASACRGAAVGPRASARLGRRRRRRPRPRDTAAATPSVAGPHQGAAAAAPAASCAAVVGQPELRCAGSTVVVCAESGLLGHFPTSPWWRRW